MFLTNFTATPALHNALVRAKRAFRRTEPAPPPTLRSREDRPSRDGLFRETGPRADGQ